jgi:4-nitrophenol 2-monooxygenase / 4-nitrocatechol 4-monooxygenase, reductase component
MTGVAIVTTTDGTDHGMTASAVSSLSLDPPMLTVCLNRSSPTQDAISRTGVFGVSILREGQSELAKRFATPRDDKFEGVAIKRGPLGQPLLVDALATIECELERSVDGGTHRVLLAAVRHAEAQIGEPLGYFRGRFGRLEILAEDEALSRMRGAILSREIGIEDPVDVDRLAERMQLAPPAVELALTRLCSERLVRREPSGFRVIPVDTERSDQALEAKLVIDRGAAPLVIARASAEQVEDLVALARRTLVQGADHALSPDVVVDHLAATEDFHERMIGLAANELLLAAYQQLRLPSVLSAVLGGSEREANRIAAGHVGIAEALRDRDSGGVDRLLVHHVEVAREVHREAIAAAGGKI